MSEVDHMVGTCPYLAEPCRTCCGYHVGGRCVFFGDPERIEKCGSANPRKWYLEALDLLGGGGR